MTAVVSVPYKCQVSVSEGTSTGVTYSVDPIAGGNDDRREHGPDYVDSGASQVGTSQVTVQATDLAGNTASTAVFHQRPGKQRRSGSHRRDALVGNHR